MEIDLITLSLIKQREKAQSRLSKAEKNKNRYDNPSIHRYERDVAQELIEDRRGA